MAASILDDGQHPVAGLKHRVATGDECMLPSADRNQYALVGQSEGPDSLTGAARVLGDRDLSQAIGPVGVGRGQGLSLA